MSQFATNLTLDRTGQFLAAPVPEESQFTIRGKTVTLLAAKGEDLYAASGVQNLAKIAKVCLKVEEGWQPKFGTFRLTLSDGQSNLYSMWPIIDGKQSGRLDDVSVQAGEPLSEGRFIVVRGFSEQSVIPDWLKAVAVIVFVVAAVGLIAHKNNWLHPPRPI